MDRVRTIFGQEYFFQDQKHIQEYVKIMVTCGCHQSGFYRSPSLRWLVISTFQSSLLKKAFHFVPLEPCPCPSYPLTDWHTNPPLY